ncbi:Transcription factor TFIIIC, tau55-related [Kalmanozyma brasiliensis GHG001]|uniref:Transcription factor TFIIIC triple barrel domain-containing protein n=1 Tax=Kalmanozyma brasiliensis (strain GHG001) TaxID=1365824 RepID=V5EPZ4_KALBG|nr:Transcription factor TFIIIC, tau55-related [Kalmanozyma brasiliensis GHG001]EST05008.1 Transcription factor TFIIIC, tau55-related [Kalmanozyma brasiliensis GHG001]
MAVEPIIDASWHRLPNDAFSDGPSSSTPLDPTSSVDDDSDGASEWSFTDDEELVTLDLGTERIAKRALLGYSAGLDFVSEPHAATATSSARTVRGSRAGGDAKATETSKPSSTTHLGAGKQMAITGLDSAQPLLKINDTVLRGRRMDLFGSEIVLTDEFDPTRPRSKQHQLQPVPPSTRDGRADARSTSTRKRILFRPIYDPAARETSGGKDGDVYEKLKALARSNQGYVLESSATRSGARDDDAQRLASVASLMGPPNGPSSTSEKGVGRGKYKRKGISEEEQMIRAAERKIRKAAKLHLQQQQEQQERQGSSSTAPQSEDTQVPAPPSHEQPQEQADEDAGSSGQDPRPPTSFDQAGL